ncbi:class I SAM-dependent methyltransferase [Timonella sp. A28]|uniref:class I SAM-dependent methyltransferase n=1 Tax=Timonella sp. A28 TaxID=3442640 RepID=UPI003EBF95B6
MTTDSSRDDATGDHYFSSSPSSQLEKRTITVELAGQQADVVTASGIFSPGHVDAGTRVLLKEMSAPPQGHVLDIGCGWGPIALSMGLLNPRATVWAVDVNERSLDLTRENAGRLGLSNVRAVFPDQVPADIQFSEMWSNPPIRIGKDALHELLLRWLPRLEVDARAFLVVQKNLGADSLQRWLNEQFSADNPHGLMAANTERIASSKGFRILETTRFGV